MIKKEKYIAPITTFNLIYEKESMLQMSGGGTGYTPGEGDDDLPTGAGARDEVDFRGESFDYSWE